MKRNLFVGLVSAATVLVLVLEGWMIVRAHRQVRQTFVVLETLGHERDVLQRLAVPPNEASTRALALELANGNERLALARASLIGTADAGVALSPARKSIEVYFDVANLVEKTRVLATQAHVAIKSDERFGFGSYAREGPPPEVLRSVRAQLEAIQFLLGALFETHPTALLSVQRERPLPGRSSNSRPQEHSPLIDVRPPTQTRDESADFFELPPTLSLRGSGAMESIAVKLEFTGLTRTLREFLNRLASCEPCLVVRSVEVEAIAAAGASPAGLISAVAEIPIPIVGQNTSRFRVIVELVTPLSPTEKAER